MEACCIARESRFRYGPITVSHRNAAFSLLEALVATSIFLVFLGFLLAITSHVSGIWQNSAEQKNRQQSARLILDRVARDLEGAIFPLNSKNADRFSFLVNPGFSGTEHPCTAFWQTASSGNTLRGDTVEVGYFVRWHNADGRAYGELCRIEIPSTASDSVLNGGGPMSEEKVGRYAPEKTDPSHPMKGILAPNVVGLWIELYGADLAPLSFPYDSRTASAIPAVAVVSIALVDSQTASRVKTSAEFTEHYTATAADFLNALPPSLQRGVKMISVKTQLETARK